MATKQPPKPTPPHADPSNPLYHPMVDRAMRDAPKRQTTPEERNAGRKPYKISPAKK